MRVRMSEQVGDYVIELLSDSRLWRVRMAGAEEYLSSHNSHDEALGAVWNYTSADQGRRR